MKKNKGGRPTKYKTEYCREVIDFMTFGYSKEAFCGRIGIAKDTLYKWDKKHKEFADAIKKGEAKSLLFWEKMGIEGATGNISGFNPSTWIFNMKNRFNWRDKRDITSDDEKIEGIVIYKPQKKEP